MRARDPLRVGARLDAAPGDLVGARRQVREVKRSGIGQDREIDVGGDLAGQRDAERVEQGEDHLAAGRGRFEHRAAPDPRTGELPESRHPLERLRQQR